MKIENIGTSKVFIKEVQLLKNYGTIKYEYEEDKVKSISDGEKRIENFYDENGRAIYSYGQQESGITTYKKNNKYNLPEKVEDYLGNIQENEYTHVPKEYQIGTEGNWKVTKSRAEVGKETKYSYGETEKVEKEESSVEIEKDKEGRIKEGRIKEYRLIYRYVGEEVKWKRIKTKKYLLYDYFHRIFCFLKINLV